jgi:hypothetical protein
VPKMMGEKLALLRCYRNNIRRYRNLLKDKSYGFAMAIRRKPSGRGAVCYGKGYGLNLPLAFGSPTLPQHGPAVVG